MPRNASRVPHTPPASWPARCDVRGAPSCAPSSLLSPAALERVANMVVAPAPVVAAPRARRTSTGCGGRGSRRTRPPTSASCCTWRGRRDEATFFTVWDAFFSHGATSPHTWARTHRVHGHIARASLSLSLSLFLSLSLSRLAACGLRRSFLPVHVVVASSMRLESVTQESESVHVEPSPPPSSTFFSKHISSPNEHALSNPQLPAMMYLRDAEDRVRVSGAGR